MVFTRSRKRDTGEVNTTTIIDNELSALLSKAKRQRTGTASATAASSTTTGATNAARTRKGRALKPVATNANANASTSTSLQNPNKGAGAKATLKKPLASATAKPVAVRATRRGRAAAVQNQQSQLKTEEEQEQQLRQQEGRETSSTGATRAGADDANTEASTDVAVAKSTSTTSLDTAGTAKAFGNSASSSYQNGTPDDIDARDAHDPLSVTDYVEDMYEHFRSKEVLSSVDSMYMGLENEGKQPNINESMRCILVDWLIEVHYKFKLFPETLYLTVNILDRFLAKTSEVVTKRDLQLVGVTALLVSAKYEEMYVPELRDLTYICDGAYTEAKILRMEEKILKTLNYNVTVPTPHTFLIRFLKAAHADKLMAQLACFLLDGTLLSLETLTCNWRPSQLAAAAILLARRQLGRHNWSPTLVAYSRYREEDVMPVARAVLQNKLKLEENRELMALAKKYSKTKYGKVSHTAFLPLESSVSDETSSSSRTSEAGDDSIAQSEL